ncbi:MAG: iron chelate uptake ABC transporter family permease subunit, partial [Thermodesulfobacteriota bacterium]|nr:iron chelate uptake ABC transporter family permease subunit [Thermodesulfobacteriota bacterium]
MKRITVTRWIFIMVGLLGTLVLAIFISSLLGTVKIGVVEGIKIIVRPFFDSDMFFETQDFKSTIVLHIRLPRLILASCVGGGLAVSGAIFQALLRNPLADPYILGISSGSALGAVCAIILGLSYTTIGEFAVPLCAFLGAFLSTSLVYTIARTNGKVPETTLLLSGVIVNFFLSAFLMLLISIARGTELHEIVFWLMGDLGRASRIQVKAAAIYIFLGIIVTLFFARDLNVISFGEEQAKSLGVEVERLKILIFIAGSFLTGVAVSVSGAIGFIGLVIPHLIRLT